MGVSGAEDAESFWLPLDIMTLFWLKGGIARCKPKEGSITKFLTEVITVIPGTKYLRSNCLRSSLLRLQFLLLNENETIFSMMK